jgi:hypothetical protein
MPGACDGCHGNGGRHCAGVLLAGMGRERSGVVPMVTGAWFLRSYSWWVLASLKMIKRSHWIDGDALRNFILACQVRGRMAERLGYGQYMTLVSIGRSPSTTVEWIMKGKQCLQIGVGMCGSVWLVGKSPLWRSGCHGAGRCHREPAVRYICLTG